jgi:hypothetical protein
MKAPERLNSPPLPEPPRGFRYYASKADILAAQELLPYRHLILRSWEEMSLAGVLTLDGIPTVYLRDDRRRLNPLETAKVHLQFWNQCVATVLLLRDLESIRVLSSMTAPLNPSAAVEKDIENHLVETVDLALQATWAESFYLQLGTGQYYAKERASRFDPQQSVDSYLLDNLGAVRDELTDETKGHQPLSTPIVHAFLGRLLFTCYLCDRGILQLKDFFPEYSWRSIRDLLSDKDAKTALYDRLFPALRIQLNSSMFDDNLDAERALIQPEHLRSVLYFLDGSHIRSGQRSLGFWAYDFKLIPVETISAIYENFLEKEGGPEKRKSGAYYTPRFLAEMTIDMALEGQRLLGGRRYLDPALGSGIFLVLLFSRLTAEWRAAQKESPPPKAIAAALRKILLSLRGVDKNLTACRIACFSLYIAYLDQFDPPGLRDYMKATGEKLPSLLRFLDSRKPAPDLEVVLEGDVFDVSQGWEGAFDVVVGNPPWQGRGSKQIAHQFMELVPKLLTRDGRACLLLPTKVLLNQTDDFQAAWLQQVTLQRVVQLADYRHILFKNALCPCIAESFTNRPPEIAGHEIEYVTPKVSRMDLRDGVIAVSPQDRKHISLRLLLDAAGQEAIGIAWKSRLWGTQRDLKFLDFLLTLPRLGDLVDILSETRGMRHKRWACGIGFKPRAVNAKSKLDRKLKPLDTWSPDDLFVPADALEDLLVVPADLCTTLGAHLRENDCLPDKLYSKPDEALFTPPLVLWNRGFTNAAFFDYKARFRHALHAVAGPAEDADSLMFLAAYLRSRLARYFVFHTGANLGTEREQVHLMEAMRLPFFLPDSEAAGPGSKQILAEVAAEIRRLQQDMARDLVVLHEQPKAKTFGPLFGDDPLSEEEWRETLRERSRRLQAELEELIYEYFGLNDQERALVEDTCAVFDRSDTPRSLDSEIPTLRPLDPAGLEPYAAMLTGTLNQWASGALKVSATGGVNDRLGLALVQLSQTKTARRFGRRSIDEDLAIALQRLQEAAAERAGSLEYLRGTWIFDGPLIYIVKPALQGQWTRTAALNDAADVYASIVQARLQRRR